MAAQALSRQRPAQQPDSSRETPQQYSGTSSLTGYLPASIGHDFTIDELNATQMVLRLEPGHTWAPGDVPGALVLEALEVAGTGFVRVLAQVPPMLSS